jgi:hypothetical protein
MGITRKFRLLAGALVAVLCADASAENVIALGPIEKVSIDGSTVQVLGQKFTIRNALTADGIQPADGAENLRVGTYLFIEGERTSDGVLVASSLQISESAYVPGASEVLLTGVVAKFDQKLGVATIGNAQVYLPNAFFELASPIVEGTSISVIGYQADPRQQIWATEILSGAPTSTQNTDRQSIQGTGVNTQSIQGTGRQSIQGTGVKTQSIQGTGIRTQSIQGTGRQSIQGTGVTTQSIQGTGVNTQSIQGTGRQSIQGTGVTTQSIQGTGVSIESIQGTGRQSIQGTGVNSLSIQGTG